MNWWNSLSFFDYMIIGLLLIFVAYKYLTWNHDYFIKRNIPYCKPLPFFGNSLRTVLKLQPFTDWIQEIYNSSPENKLVGFFQFLYPTIMVRNPELLKQIGVKDFDHFMNHNNILPDDVEPLFAANLVMLKGQKWKYLRALLSPAFTSSKMKGMFPLITECGQQLVDHLQMCLKESGKDMLDMDMKDLFTRFTNDATATSAFGISCLKNPKNEFYMCGKNISNFGGLKLLVIVGYMLCPKLMKFFNIGFFGKTSKEFLCKTVRETIETREREGIVRPDMIHLLMQARRGELKDEEINNVDKTTETKIMEYDLTDTDITAQAMIFFLAGFETSAVLFNFASLLLAMHQDIQKRLQEEIDHTLENCDGHITYDGLQNMKYMDMVISETLRIYPPSPVLDRQCIKSCRVAATDDNREVIIKAKEAIFLPVYAIHRDPKYYPEPEKFDPERFSEENKHNIKPFTYFPFGLGPRSCIGNRFALMEDKVALVFLLSQFSVHSIDKSSVPIKLAASGVQMMPEKGFWLGIKKRQLN